MKSSGKVSSLYKLRGKITTTKKIVKSSESIDSTKGANETASSDTMSRNECAQGKSCREPRPESQTIDKNKGAKGASAPIRSAENHVRESEETLRKRKANEAPESTSKTPKPNAPEEM